MAGFSDLLASVGKQSVQSVTFRSQVTPEFEFDPWAQQQEPPVEGESMLMKLVKPSFVLNTAGGPVEIAPYGTPTGNYFPLLLGAAALMAVGAIVGIGYIARKF
jgi:hypothetical protein